MKRRIKKKKQNDMKIYFNYSEILKKSLHVENSRKSVYTSCEKNDAGADAKLKIDLTWPK